MSVRTMERVLTPLTRYSLQDGASFAEQASKATFDLTTDEAVSSRQRHSTQLSWDKKKKKFIKGDGVGADNVKLVRTESGARLPASYRSGRFDEWKAKSRVRLPKVGEAEGESRGRMGGGRNFRHKKVEEGKPLDPLHVGYERKARQFTKKASEKEGGNDGERPSSSQGGGRGKGGRPPPHGRGKPGVLGRKPVGKVKSEIKTVQEIHKNRKIQEKRREKNARHSKGKGKGRR
jgi:ATP-dependent RNA helicase DDX54/DBP10